MRSLTCVSSALLLCIAFAACDNRETGAMNEDSDTTINNGSRAANVTAREEDFVDDAIENNNEEMAWLHAAIKNGTDTELKSQAQQMLSDHQKMGEDLKGYAATKNIEIEEEDTTTTILDINEDIGHEWDEEWSDEMADKHRKLIRRFERAERQVDDAELKGIITNALPKLRSHLDMTTKLEERLDKVRR